MFCNLNTIKIMKNKLRKGFLVISLGFLFAFGACSEDITQIETPKNEKELKWNTRTFEELKLNSRFLKSYEKVSEKLNKIKTSKNSEYDFVIDSTSIYEVVKDNYTSYTFSIYRNNLPEFVSYYENLFIEIDSSNVPKASILKFNLNPLNNVVSSIEQTTVLENPYLFNKGGLEDDFDDASKCTTVYIYYVETCGCEGQHWPGDPSCDCPSSPPVSVFLNTYETCNTGGTGTGTGDPSTGVITYNPNYTGSGGTYSSTSTAVSNPTNYITQRRKSLRRNLPEGLGFHSQNYIWLNSQNESVQGAIYSYLETAVNGIEGLISSVPLYPQSEVLFVNQLIEYCRINNLNENDCLNYINSSIIEKKINVTNLDPCGQSIFNRLKVLEQNDVAAILRKLGDVKSDYNLTILNGIPTDPNSLASTNWELSPLQEIISYNYKIKVRSEHTQISTDLALASTILHEIIHAYFLSILDDCIVANNCTVLQSYPDLWNFYVANKTGNFTNGLSQHNQIANSYVNIMGAALQEFITGVPVVTGQQSQVYTDLAWYGLEGTIPYNALPVDDKNRIQFRFNNVELLNQSAIDSTGATITPIGTRNLPCQ